MSDNSANPYLQISPQDEAELRDFLTRNTDATGRELGIYGQFAFVVSNVDKGEGSEPASTDAPPADQAAGSALSVQIRKAVGDANDAGGRQSALVGPYALIPTMGLLGDGNTLPPKSEGNKATLDMS